MLSSDIGFNADIGFFIGKPADRKSAQFTARQPGELAGHGGVAWKGNIERHSGELSMVNMSVWLRA